ncbi:MAG: hypothetical protein WC551_11585 [Patescibacteria group bacterium]
MNSVLRVLAMAVILFTCSCGSCDQMAKDLASEGYIDRRIVLYSANGDTLRVWEGDIYVENVESTEGLSFLIAGERFIISGTYLIEEI